MDAEFVGLMFWDYLNVWFVQIASTSIFMIHIVSIVPEGKDENTEMEVYNFTGNGGVALAMYNTDEVQLLSIFFNDIGFLYIDICI